MRKGNKMDAFMQLLIDIGFVIVVTSLALTFTYRGKRAYLAIRFKLQGRK